MLETKEAFPFGFHVKACPLEYTTGEPTVNHCKLLVYYRFF